MTKPSLFVVPSAIAPFVANGGRDVETAKLDVAALATHAAHVRLVDDRDVEIGQAVHDAGQRAPAR